MRIEPRCISRATARHHIVIMSVLCGLLAVSCENDGDPVTTDDASSPSTTDDSDSSTSTTDDSDSSTSTTDDSDSSSSTSTDPETGNGTVEIPEPPASFRVSPPQSNDEVDAAAQGLIARLAEPSVQSFVGAPAPSARTEALLELHALLGFPVFTDGGGRLITEGFEGEGIETFWWEVWYLAAGPHGGMTTLADVADYLAISAAAPNDLQGEDSFALRYALLREPVCAKCQLFLWVRFFGNLCCDVARHPG